jgi:hypothetical protein
MGTGLMRPDREAAHSPPTSAEVKKSTHLHGVALNNLSTGTNLPFSISKQSSVYQHYCLMKHDAVWFGLTPENSNFHCHLCENLKSVVLGFLTRFHGNLPL